MNLKKIGMALLLIGSLAVVTSCSSEKEEKKEAKKEAEKKKYYDGELTEEEMSDTHLSLELMENVTVDADITSLKDYENGLKSYFIQRPDGKKITQGKKIEGKGYVPKDYNQVKKIIAENVEGTFDQKKDKSFFQKKERHSTSALLTDSISGKIFSYHIELDGKNRPYGKSISVDRYYKSNKEKEDKYYLPDGNILWSVLDSNFDSLESDLSFGSREAIGEKLREQAGEILGKKLSDRYEGYAVDEEIYNLAAQEWDEREGCIKCPADFYVYYFYQDIDGFPWKTESLQLQLEEGEEYEYEVGTYGDDTLAYSLAPENQMISYGKDGIRELSLSDTIEYSKVYKEQKILPLDEMLIKIGDYYLSNASNTLMANIISEIKICYISVFSDGEDGKIRNVAKPCWEVKIGQKHYDGVEYSSLYFDAETGEYITGYMQH